MSEEQIVTAMTEEMQKEFDVRVNTLNSVLPQNAPFVIQQVSEAVKMLQEQGGDITIRNLDMAISVARQVSKFSQGDIVYNYVPIVLALLQDLRTISLDKFDTINHDIPMSFSLIQTFIDRYPVDTKTAPTTFLNLHKEGQKNVCLVILARFLADVNAGKNALNVAYIMNNLNSAKVQFMDEAFQFYVDILTAVNNAQY